MRRDGLALGGNERLGLGAEAEAVDPFAAFRKSRAAGYHQRIEDRVKFGPEAVAAKCFNCGKSGHFARECSNP